MHALVVEKTAVKDADICEWINKQLICDAYRHRGSEGIRFHCRACGLLLLIHCSHCGLGYLHIHRHVFRHIKNTINHFYASQKYNYTTIKYCTYSSVIEHPSINQLYQLHTYCGTERVGRVEQLTLERGRSTPWTGWQSIKALTYRDKEPHTFFLGWRDKLMRTS